MSTPSWNDLHPRNTDGTFSIKLQSEHADGTGADLDSGIKPSVEISHREVDDLRNRWAAAAEAEDRDDMQEYASQAADLIRGQVATTPAALKAVEDWEWADSDDEAYDATEEMFTQLTSSATRS